MLVMVSPSTEVPDVCLLVSIARFRVTEQIIFIYNRNFLSSLKLYCVSVKSASVRWDHSIRSSARLSQKIDPLFSNPPNWDKMSISEVSMGILSMLCEWASWGIVTLLAPSVLGAYCQLANGAQTMTSDLESAPLGLLEKWCLRRVLGIWVITRFCPLKTQKRNL